MTNSKNRYDYLDILRVIAMVLVMALHSVCDYYASPIYRGRNLWYVVGYANEIARLGVPIFFMISGYLILNKEISNITEFYKKRITKIGVPFIAYDIFYFLFNCNRNNITPSVNTFFKELFISGSSYHLWFIYSILLIYLLAPFIQMIVKNCSAKTLFLLLILITFQTTLRPFINTLLNGTFTLYFADDGFNGYIGYVVLGYILGKFNFTKKSNCIICFVSLVTFIITPVFTMKSAVKTGEYLLMGGYNINHYLEAMGLFLIGKYYLNKRFKLIEILSSSSFSAYFIHVFMLEKLKTIPLPLPPSAVMLIWFAGTVILSFLWGIAINAFKGMLAKNKQI